MALHLSGVADSVLERRVQLLVSLGFRKNNANFVLVHTGPALYPCEGVNSHTPCMGVGLHVYMCFVYLKSWHTLVSLDGSCGSCFEVLLITIFVLLEPELDQACNISRDF